MVGTGILLVLCLGVALAGCKKGDTKGSTSSETRVVKDTRDSGDNKVTKANFEKLKDDMTEKQITEILGAPTSTKETQGGGKELTWKNGNNQVTIGFAKDGKVEYKSSQFVN
jgi:outer membrane protein assembly factor BamE (lipoprotein component of BamABCDE complex)